MHRDIYLLNQKIWSFPYKNKQQRKVTKTLENIVLLTKIETMNDETVVRTRLLLDGDGTGDDRRLNMIAKSVSTR